MSESQGAPRFNILWIEDSKEAMELQKKEVVDYITKKGFTANIIPRENGDDAELVVLNENVDVVVTDMNIIGGKNGEQVVKTLREKAILTDVLFYSAKGGIDPTQAKESLAKYGFIAFAFEKRDVAFKLKKLVEKNLKRWEDLMLLRGIIISQTIDLELRLNEVFANYFNIPQDDREYFIQLVMENHFQLEGKIQAIRRILADHEIKKDFKDLLDGLPKIQNARNDLAHCREDSNNKNWLVSVGKSEPFRKEDLQKLLCQIRHAFQRVDELGIIIEEAKKKIPRKKPEKR